MKICFNLFFGLIFILLLNDSLFSETVILKSGKSINGKVIDQNKDLLKIKDKDGNLLQFPKTDILKVSYQDLNVKEVKKIIEVETKKNFSTSNNESQSSEITNPNTMKKIRKEVVFRSAILPGLGQFHWNEPVWGSVYLIAFLGAAINYNQAWNLHKEAKSEYQNDFRSLVLLGSGNSGFVLNLIDKNNLASEYRKTGNAVNSASNIVIGVFLISLIDSMLYRADKKENPLTNFEKRPGFYLNTDINQTHQQNLYTKDKRFTQESIEYKIGYTWVF
ncbi:hypothetical protein AB3N60_10645 [Leptospira sp. WS39.C2]